MSKENTNSQNNNDILNFRQKYLKYRLKFQNLKAINANQNNYPFDDVFSDTCEVEFTAISQADLHARAEEFSDTSDDD